jgi:ribosomal protein L24
MSDMLEKLLGAEKGAAGLVAEAEAEAGKRVARVRAEAQKAHTELLKSKAIETDSAVTLEKARIVSEREQKNREYREKLARQPADRAAFKRTASSFLE